MKHNPIVIVSMARTPTGNFLGSLKDCTAPQLGAQAIAGACARSSLEPGNMHEVLMGCVLSAGLGQAPARQAALGAGLPYRTPCTTINKMCGSGMKAVMLAHDILKSGSTDIVIAGGMESMSNAPYLVAKARPGLRIGHHVFVDEMLLDGLEDAYEKGKPMGAFAEETAKKYGFSREAQDEFALRSLTRAQQAAQQGIFKDEIVPVTVSTPKGESIVAMDEGPQTARPEKIPLLKPAFSKDGTVTAANSSSISDGAAALVLMQLSTAEKLGLTPLATIQGFSTFAQEPAWFTTAPVGAIQTLLKKMDWGIHEVDLYEINEAFAVVTMVAMHDLNLSADQVNIHGGACCLGHPIGASGARILVSLINSLQKHNLKRGIAALCIGGGEATAMAIERFMG